MTITVADLVARFRADTSDAERGLQQTRQQLSGVSQEARATGEQIDQLARKFASSQGGTAAGWVSVLQQQHLSARQVAEQLGSAATSAARAAAATHQMVQPTQAAAKAASDMHEGFRLSESSAVRFAGSAVGIGLGLSVAATAGRVLHDVVAGTLGAQLEWERSVKTLSGLYGDVGGRVAALASAQSNLPGVLGTQQEFAQAAINASVLNLRYGLSPQMVNQLTTTGGRVAFATGMTDEADRRALQAQILAAVQSGTALPPQYGVFVDPESVARRLGAPGAQTLQAYTPNEVMQARQAIVSGDLSAFADRAAANRRAALDAVTAAEKAAEQARSLAQAAVEGAGGSSSFLHQMTVGYQLSSSMGLDPRLGYAADAARQPGGSSLSAMQGNSEDALRALVTAQSAEAAALEDSTKAQEAARSTFERLSQTVDAAGAKLLGFFGSLEATTSIAHGDILAGAQGAVAARARSAIPLIGMGTRELGALASNDAWQAAWQNFVAYQAQDVQTNVIRRNLQQQADVGRFAGLAPDRQDPRSAAAAAAQRALAETQLTEPIYTATREVQSRGALINQQAAEQQAGLDAIALTQRERSLRMLQDTAGLRAVNIEQQMGGITAGQGVIRAQQAALGPGRAVEDAQYQSTRAGVLARARTARLLQGRDVSDLPSFDELIQMNVEGQFAEAEAEPAALEAGRAIQVAQRPATAAGLAQQLTAGQLQFAELGVDLKNLGDLPQQTALEVELVQTNKSQLGIQTEMRELLKALVFAMGNRQGGSGGALTEADVSAALRASSNGGVPASPQLAGARR